jgi:hypothetical protein
MADKDRKSFLEGRSSETGRFESVENARRHPATSQVERVPLPGRGDAKDDKKK